MRVQIPGWGYLEMIATVLLPISILLSTTRIRTRLYFAKRNRITPHHLLRRSFPLGGSRGESKPSPYGFAVAQIYQMMIIYLFDISRISIFSTQSEKMFLPWEKVLTLFLQRTEDGSSCRDAPAFRKYNSDNGDTARNPRRSFR